MLSLKLSLTDDSEGESLERQWGAQLSIVLTPSATHSSSFAIEALRFPSSASVRAVDYVLGMVLGSWAC